jgi:hypothetical protein
MSKTCTSQPPILVITVSRGDQFSFQRLFTGPPPFHPSCASQWTYACVPGAVIRHSHPLTAKENLLWPTM